MTRNEFNDWIKTFCDKWGGFKPPLSWFDECEKVHENLREKLGGIRKIVKVELANATVPLELSRIAEPYNKLNTLIPDYFNYHNIRSEKMVFPFYTTEIVQGNGQKKKKDVKWGKHINYWLNLSCNKGKFDNKKLRDIDSVLQKLGSEWSKCKTQKQMSYVNMTTDPRAFVQIGHYGPDSGSCFRQKSGNQLNKYQLGVYPTSYVLLVQNYDGEERGTNLDNLNPDNFSRMWGVANKDLNIFNLANYYPNKNLSESNIFHSVDKFFSQLFKTDKAKKHQNLIKISDVFQNTGFNYTYSKSENPGPQIFSIPKAGPLLDMVPCRKCGENQCKDDLILIDEQFYCTSCYASLPICEWSKIKTTEALISVYNRENQHISIRNSFINNGIFVLCVSSRHYFHKDDMVMTIFGGYISKFVMKAYGYDICTSCNVSSIGIKDGKCKYCQEAKMSTWEDLYSIENKSAETCVIS